MLKLFELDQQPEAKTAHLLLSTQRARPQNYKVRSSFTWALSLNREMPSTNQLRALYPEHPSDQILCSFLEEALKREPQNPLLLLAKLRPTLPMQTTTSLNSRALKSPSPPGYQAKIPRMTKNFDQGILIWRIWMVLEHAPQDVWWQNPRTELNKCFPNSNK